MNGRELSQDHIFRGIVEKLLPELGLKLKGQAVDPERPLSSEKRDRFADQMLEYPQNLVNRFVNAILIDETITEMSKGDDIKSALISVIDILSGIKEGEK